MCTVIEKYLSYHSVDTLEPHVAALYTVKNVSSMDLI
jgi:hypothetical protein